MVLDRIGVPAGVLVDQPDVLGPGYFSTFAVSFVLRYVVTGDTAGNEAGTRTGVTLTTRAMSVRSRLCT